jgi:hypothetical protein
MPKPTVTAKVSADLGIDPKTVRNRLDQTFADAGMEDENKGPEKTEPEVIQRAVKKAEEAPKRKLANKPKKEKTKPAKAAPQPEDKSWSATECQAPRSVHEFIIAMNECVTVGRRALAELNFEDLVSSPKGDLDDWEATCGDLNNIVREMRRMFKQSKYARLGI